MILVSLIVTAVSIYYIGTTVDRIRERRAILDSRQNIQLNFEEVLSFYSEEYGGLRANLDEILPSEENIAPILQSIETRSKTIGINAEIRYTPTEIPANTINFIRYRVSFEGNKTQLLSFIELLNNLPVYTEVLSIDSISIDEFEFDQIAKHEVFFDIFIRNN